MPVQKFFHRGVRVAPFLSDFERERFEKLARAALFESAREQALAQQFEYAPARDR